MGRECRRSQVELLHIKSVLIGYYRELLRQILLFLRIFLVKCGEREGHSIVSVVRRKNDHVVGGRLNGVHGLQMVEKVTPVVLRRRRGRLL